MMKSIRLAKCVLAFLVAVLVMGCDIEDPVVTPDFTNHTSGYLVKVKNNTAIKLVAFKGEVAESSLIGGIPASSSHGLPKPEGMFTESTDFVMVIISEESYNDNISNLSKAPIFTKLLVHYNKSAIDTVAYEISGNLGGEATLRIANSEEMNVELRLNGIYGQPIGYAPPSHYNLEIFVSPGDYLFFPVFRKYSQQLDEMITVFPKLNDKPRFFSMSIGIGDIKDINIPKDYIGTIDYEMGYAYVIVQNDSSIGFYFSDGNTPLYTRKGYYTINSGDSAGFEIGMPGEMDSLKESITKSTFKVSIAEIEVTIPEYTFFSGYTYTIRITGGEGGLTHEETKEDGEIPIQSLFASN